MIIHFTKPSLKQLSRLPDNVKKKALKQFKFLNLSSSYSSLKFKKMSGKNTYEGRIDYQYRFVGEFIKNNFYVLSIGPHDEGLGKK